MSIYDKASLVLIPSGTKTSKVYSQKPVSGDGDFTFSRSTAATRVNASGNIEKETENLLLQSNSFDTTWTNFNSNETDGQSGYDGTSDAWLLTKTGTNGNINQVVSSSGVTTFSVYAKSQASDWIFIRIGSPALHEVYFDIANGVIGSETNVIDSNIEAAGNGYYRCSVTANVSSGSYVRFYVADSDGVTSGTSGSIYIQDAQLEYGLVARDYIETTTTAIYGGITDNVPRLDYTDSSCPALLLEPQRSNLCTSSEYLNSSIWNNLGSSVTDNDAISPEGLQNAAKVQGDGSQNYIRLYDNLTYPSTGNYTLTFFAKKGNNDFIRVAMLGVTGAESAYFDLANGTTPQTNVATIQAIGTDGWYKCSVSANLTGPDLTGNYNLYVSYSDTTSTFPSAGDANGQYVYLYGCQLEQGSYATSYIPTYGSAVTRNAETCSKTSATSLIGQTEGTLFAEFDGYENTGSEGNRIIAIGDGTSSKRIMILDSNTNIRFLISNSGTQTDYNSSISAEGNHKVAIAYANNDISMYIDGVQVSTDSSASIPTCPNIYIGTREDGNVTPLAGGIKKALVFKTRLTNAELADLTTL